VLGSIKANTPEVIESLLGALKDYSAYVRRCAAKALGSIKENTPELIEGLLGALKDYSENVRIRAAKALGLIKLEKKITS